MQGLSIVHSYGKVYTGRKKDTGVVYAIKVTGPTAAACLEQLAARCSRRAKW